MITRRQALAIAAAGAVARPAIAFAAGTDRGPLAALVAYQQEVVFGYEVALQEAPLRRTDRDALDGFRRESLQAAAALRKALQDEGGKPPPPPDPATAPPPGDPSRRGYLRDLITAEELAVGSYYTAMQSLEDARHLQGSAAFMAQAGRRLVVLRELAGDPLLPHAFETGTA
jgi:hypothetical protein